MSPHACRRSIKAAHLPHIKSHRGELHLSPRQIRLTAFYKAEKIRLAPAPESRPQSHHPGTKRNHRHSGENKAMSGIPSFPKHRILWLCELHTTGADFEQKPFCPGPVWARHIEDPTARGKKSRHKIQSNRTVREVCFIPLFGSSMTLPSRSLLQFIGHGCRFSQVKNRAACQGRNDAWGEPALLKLTKLPALEQFLFKIFMCV